MCARGVSVEYPSAPWTWIERSMTRFSMLATKCLAIDTSPLKSTRSSAGTSSPWRWAASILDAACSTISLDWYSSIVESAISHWMPCFSASNEPWL